MLRTRTNGPQAKPDIQRAIDSLLKEGSNFDKIENRSAHREHLVRPVKLEIRDLEEVICGFSRNVSATGIGVVSSVSFSAQTVAVLKIAQLTGGETPILAECRWSKPYGDHWHISGWQFINLKR